MTGNPSTSSRPPSEQDCFITERGTNFTGCLPTKTKCKRGDPGEGGEVGRVTVSLIRPSPRSHQRSGKLRVPQVRDRGRDGTETRKEGGRVGSLVGGGRWSGPLVVGLVLVGHQDNVHSHQELGWTLTLVDPRGWGSPTKLSRSHTGLVTLKIFEVSTKITRR